MKAAAALLMAATMLLAGCDSERRAISRDDLPDVSGPRVTIEVDETGYDPDRITARSGDLLVLRNAGDGPHSFTADAFDTGLLQPGEQTIVQLTTPDAVEVTDRAGGGHTLTIEVVPDADG